MDGCAAHHHGITHGVVVGSTKGTGGRGARNFLSAVTDIDLRKGKGERLHAVRVIQGQISRPAGVVVERVLMMLPPDSPPDAGSNTGLRGAGGGVRVLRGDACIFCPEASLELLFKARRRRQEPKGRYGRAGEDRLNS
jgi:hypothetical protein